MDKQQTTRLSIEVPKHLHKQLKTMAALNGISIKQLILSCLDEYLLSSNVPNEETMRVFEKTEHGEGLITCKDIDDLFDKLGLNE